jgi:hypothetical protein
LCNYFVFASVSAGIWTDHAVCGYEIKKQFKRHKSKLSDIDKIVKAAQFNDTCQPSCQPSLDDKLIPTILEVLKYLNCLHASSENNSTCSQPSHNSTIRLVCSRQWSTVFNIAAYLPGNHGGWHYHSQPTIALIGQLTTQQSTTCASFEPHLAVWLP